MRVVGLDLSLRSTGVADERGTRTVSCKVTGMERLVVLREALLQTCGFLGSGGDTADQLRADLVVIEDYAFHKADAHAHALGELGGVVRLALFEAGIPYVNIKGSSLKKYASGRGNAPKDVVLVAAAKRLPDFDGGNDEADAAWLRAMALDHYGEPVVDMPALNRSALAAVPWPELVTA